MYHVSCLHTCGVLAAHPVVNVGGLAAGFLGHADSRDAVSVHTLGYVAWMKHWGQAGGSETFVRVVVTGCTSAHRHWVPRCHWHCCPRRAKKVSREGVANGLLVLSVDECVCVCVCVRVCASMV